MRRFAAGMPMLWTALVAASCAGCATGVGRRPHGVATLPAQAHLPPAGIFLSTDPPTLTPPPEAPDQLPLPPSRAAEKPPNKTAGEKHLPAPRKLTENPEPGAIKPLPGPEGGDTTLELAEVLQSVEEHFPLLLAAELERAVTSGQRLAALGVFDLNLRARHLTQGGTFPSNRFDVAVEQPTLFGPSLVAGYRVGVGDFPVYYGDRQTAQGGEFRAGLLLPLLRDLPIDRRRAALRQAQVTEALADPAVQRARIDYFRAATRAYWNWVAAGEQYFVADNLLRIARERQAGLEEQFKQGQVAEFVVIDNRRLVVEREGGVVSAERRWQQTGFDLSLFLRDPAGNPTVPAGGRLPRLLPRSEPAPPDPGQLPEEIETAYALRPELIRFQLLKERATIELRLAENLTLPALNAGVYAAQDVGEGKKSTGSLALDRSTVEGQVSFEVPLQRREARGRTQAANATLMQLLAQERFARDQIGAEVQDAVSNLDRTARRLALAREEQRIAQRVADLEGERYRKGQATLLELNLREIAAAGAQAKVVEALADYFRALADYRAALGLDARPNK